MSRILCSASCTREAVRRIDGAWFCFWHPQQDPPDIDLLTGRVRQPAEKRKPKKPAPLPSYREPARVVVDVPLPAPSAPAAAVPAPLPAPSAPAAAAEPSACATAGCSRSVPAGRRAHSGRHSLTRPAPPPPVIPASDPRVEALLAQLPNAHSLATDPGLPRRIVAVAVRLDHALAQLRNEADRPLGRRRGGYRLSPAGKQKLQESAARARAVQAALRNAPPASVHCFFGCGKRITDAPEVAHVAMEQHYSRNHADEVADLTQGVR